ncbi:MAG: tRNA lysidine(34) synthetase TilS [Ginsengibacter sp.]
MSLPDNFKDYIQKKNLFIPGDNLIVAVSGGIDSMVLCDLCNQAAFNFTIAHCNFQLRGEESERDEIFVKSLGEKYNVKVFVKKFETDIYANENKVSIQVAARELRYSWFNELITENDDQIKRANSNETETPKSHRTSNIVRDTFLLTAHHANDNIETLLMNFFKGTGITGLKGIEPKKGKVIRPLLFAKKEELQEYARANDLQYVEDSSNSSDKYTRNYFRNQLIPSLQKIFPGVEENLISNITRFKDIETLYLQAINQHKKKLIEERGDEIHMPVLKLLKSKPLAAIVFEIIKEYGFTSHQTGEVIKILNSDSGRYISSATHKIIKNRNWIIIAPHNTLKASNILINKDDKEIKFQEGILKMETVQRVNQKITANKNIVLLDSDTITFPLLLRKWKQGDYFYPLGMKKKSGALAKKKLSKFFIDQKIPIQDKEKIWVLESNKKIVWILNNRIDDRFKVTDHTVNLLRLTQNTI